MKTEILFTPTPLVPPALEPASREIGAVVDFLGLVREMEGESALEGLEYEAYEPMARRHLERLFLELAQVHPVESVIFHHRLGWVAVGEASIFIRVQASHRAEALLFCGNAIDRMKRDVPIWKRMRAG